MKLTKKQTNELNRWKNAINEIVESTIKYMDESKNTKELTDERWWALHKLDGIGEITYYTIENINVRDQVNQYTMTAWKKILHYEIEKIETN